MEKAKYTAKQVANWFIHRFNQDVANGGEYLTQLKLQKLMYFAQGYSLAYSGNPLFTGEIIHRQYGAVVKELANYFMSINQQSEPIKDLIDAPETKFSLEDDALLDVIYKRFGQYSAYKLVEICHGTQSWLDTNEGETISLKSMKKYFKGTD